MNRPLPLLPLLLWKTPPGLELILRQEGVPFRRLIDLSESSLSSGRLILFDGRSGSSGNVRSTASQDHSTIDIDELRTSKKSDPFADLIDTRSVRKAWHIDDFRLIERVSLVDKARLRRGLIEALRRLIEQAGGVYARISVYPHPYRSAFNFRADLDETYPDDYRAFALARRPIDDCTTHFVSTAAYAQSPAVLDDLRGLDTQSHGHFHVIYRSEDANRRNLHRAHEILTNSRFKPTAFAAPEGRWNPGLDRAMEELGYTYSSDFSVGYSDLPFHPWVAGRFSSVLQIPVHPICEGLFLDAGCNDPRTISDHLIETVKTKVDSGDPAFVYGHPERRLGRFPEVVSALAIAVGEIENLWRVTLTEFATWWRWRDNREWSLALRESGDYEVQFKNWSLEYPIRLEVFQGYRVASTPLTAATQVLSADFQMDSRKRFDGPEPVVLQPSRGWKSLLQSAIDWETVTPMAELPVGGFRNRLKRQLRQLKQDRHIATPVAPIAPIQECASIEPRETATLSASRSRFLNSDRSSDEPRRPSPPIATIEPVRESNEHRKVDSDCVLVHAPSFAFQSPGGGENQLIQTSRHLQELDVQVRFFSPWVDQIANSRLLHLYGMSREGLELARVARAKGVPVALSPICWFEPRALSALASSRPKAALALATWSARRLIPRLPDWRRELLESSDMILPNSLAETRQLAQLFGVDYRRVKVVPNGVDPRFASASPELFHERFGESDFILYIGRIEPRKNVLGLIRAARSAGYPLVVIGSPVPGHETYASRCRSVGEGSVTWIDRLDHADPLLESAIAAARVFALPSWFETPGLAALEAAAAGCPIVITPHGCTREYFGESVEYARPGKEREIIAALTRAWNDRAGRAALSERVVTRFSWSQVARATKEAYDRIAP